MLRMVEDSSAAVAFTQMQFHNAAYLFARSNGHGLWSLVLSEGNVMTMIGQFSDGTTLRFSAGRFDAWCVLLSNARVANYAPKDWEYFTRLRQLADRYGAESLYHDFVGVYDRTTATLEPSVLAFIARVSMKYAADATRVEVLFAILYATMVAEENKHKAILKKRIKRLAVHQMLLEHMPVAEVVVWSKGRRWQELDAACRQRGF